MFRKPANFRHAAQPRSLRRRLLSERLDARRLMAGDLPLGTTFRDTGEFLLGRVAVTPVFFDSDGSIDTETQDWAPGEIDAVMGKIVEGVNWWAQALDELDTVHELEFVVDRTFADNPVQTGYEPIDRTSNEFGRYFGPFLEDQGYNPNLAFEDQVFAFNHDQREALEADWSFTIVVVDSSDDPTGQFAPGGSFGSAFAFPGGLFMVLPSARPASTVAHEMGHIFWARDEYPGGGSFVDQRGYYNAQNLNASDNPTPGFVQETSIMRAGQSVQEAFTSLQSPASTFAMVGWRDSDGDGIFDVLDVPLSLNVDGYFDSDSGMLEIRGDASAVPLRNVNSSGPQSDITLNQIDALQYRIDDGAWTTFATPETATASFQSSVNLPGNPTQIEIRAIDLTSGVTSQVVTADMVAGGGGVITSQPERTRFTYLDENDNGVLDAGESSLENVRVRLIDGGGETLESSVVDPTELTPGFLPQTGVNDFQLSVVGIVHDDRAGIQPGLSGENRIAGFNAQSSAWETTWRSRAALIARPEKTFASIEIDLQAGTSQAYGRAEAYDADGNFLRRVTSGEMRAGDRETITLDNPTGDIAQIRVFGHAGTGVEIVQIRGVYPAETMSSSGGVFRLDDLPPGTYNVELLAENSIHDFSSVTQITIDGNGAGNGNGAVEGIAATRGDSPWHNGLDGYDVDGENGVSPRDALLVLNEIRRGGGSRILEREFDGFDVDVDNNGTVSPLDALLVLNEYRRRLSGGSGGGEGEAFRFDVSTAELAFVPIDALQPTATLPGALDVCVPLDAGLGLDASLGPEASLGFDAGWGRRAEGEWLAAGAGSSDDEGSHEAAKFIGPLVDAAWAEFDDYRAASPSEASLGADETDQPETLGGKEFLL
ncbi:MAG: protein containing Planctomycete extracellular domain protein [Planctomycetota bacterium]